MFLPIITGNSNKQYRRIFQMQQQENNNVNRDYNKTPTNN